eukprot:763091-Pelagomonas_calceolata.AAC.3
MLDNLFFQKVGSVKGSIQLGAPKTKRELQEAVPQKRMDVLEPFFIIAKKAVRCHYFWSLDIRTFLRYCQINEYQKGLIWGLILSVFICSKHSSPLIGTIQAQVPVVASFSHTRAPGVLLPDTCLISRGVNPSF